MNEQVMLSYTLPTAETEAFVNNPVKTGWLDEELTRLMEKYGYVLTEQGVSTLTQTRDLTFEK